MQITTSVTLAFLSKACYEKRIGQKFLYKKNKLLLKLSNCFCSHQSNGLFLDSSYTSMQMRWHSNIMSVYGSLITSKRNMTTVLVCYPSKDSLSQT